MILKNGHIVSFGDSHMVIGLVLEKKDRNEENNLTPINGSPNLSAKKNTEKILITQLMI